MDRHEDKQSTVLTLKDTNHQITLQDKDRYGLLNITEDGDMTYIPYKLRKDDIFTLRQDSITREPYFVNKTIGTDIRIDRFINPIQVSILEATDVLLDTAEKQLLDLQLPTILIVTQGTIELFAGPTCKIIDTLNVRDRETNQIQDVRSDLTTLQTHKYQTVDGEYRTEVIKKLVYDASPTRGSDIFWMPPATKETTTPMVSNVGDREARQKPALWTPPSGPSSMTMVITSGSGVKRNLRLSDKGKITWFRKDRKSGGLAVEERQADDENTTLSLEVNDTANTINLTKTKIINNRVQSTTENIFS